MEEFRENTINLIAEGTRLEGKLRFEQTSRIHGVLIGEIESPPGGALIIAESGYVEGAIDADVVIIDGFVKGEIRARTRVVVSETGRVIGDIHSANLQLEYGCFFEGRANSSPQTTADAPLPA